MSKKLWVVTPHFNPIGYNSLEYNLNAFSKRILEQGANLCRVKLFFPSNNEEIFYDRKADNLIDITTTANSISWHKEALINIALRYLKDEADSIAWIDGDVLFPDGWLKIAEEKLLYNDVVQLFKKVYLLNPREGFGGISSTSVQSVVWQNKIHKDWLNRRLEKNLPYAVPGFAWAAKTDFLMKVGGLYDKAITGSADVVFTDALLYSEHLHTYYSMLTEYMKKDVDQYITKVRSFNPVYDYLPIDIYHLYHGTLTNRNYINRHSILNTNNYDPNSDLIFDSKHQIYEIKNKPSLETDLKQYFVDRNEDNNG